jgi:thioredoxin-like negative regulator of GroEL
MYEWIREDLSSLLNNKLTGIIYFYTPLCGTCQLASKMLEVVGKIVDVKIGKMNLNFFPDLAGTFKIESVPCLLMVKDGKVIETIYAFHSVPFLLEKINNLK